VARQRESIRNGRGKGIQGQRRGFVFVRVEAFDAKEIATFKRKSGRYQN